MSSSKRRKTESYDSGKTEQANTCILHATEVSDGHFIPLSNIKGLPTDKLEFLHTVRNQRLQEPFESPNRMANISAMISDSLDSIDVNTTGYHRGCYQNFRRNLERICNQPATCSKSLTEHSPRKSLISALRLFPP